MYWHLAQMKKELTQSKDKVIICDNDKETL